MIDHYKVLGLPSGDEGRNLTSREIKKAYKMAALKLHPDKSLSDPNAVAKFQQLQSSYELLMNDKTREPFDDLLRALSRQKAQQEARSRQEDLLAEWRQAQQQKQKQRVAEWQKDFESRWRQARTRTDKSRSKKSANNSDNVKSNWNRERKDYNRCVDLEGPSFEAYLKQREKRGASAMKDALKEQQERSAKIFQDEIAKAQAMRDDFVRGLVIVTSSRY